MAEVEDTNVDSDIESSAEAEDKTVSKEPSDRSKRAIVYHSNLHMPTLVLRPGNLKYVQVPCTCQACRLKQGGILIFPAPTAAEPCSLNALFVQRALPFHYTRGYYVINASTGSILSLKSMETAD